MEIVNTKDNQITFKAKAEESLANAIRRYLHQIPVLAIDEVEISKNDSPLYDETFAHRIGLVPLKMEKSFKEDKVVKLKLKSKKEGNVYSEELKGDAEVVYDKIPLTFLNKDQEVELVASARIGKGCDHSKFSPGLMFYRDNVKIKIDKDVPKEIVDVCPQKIFKNENDKIVIQGEEKCDMCEACTEFCKKKGKDSIQLVPQEELIITIESFGQLDIKDIVGKSIDTLKKDLAEVGKKLK